MVSMRSSLFIALVLFSTDSVVVATPANRVPTIPSRANAGLGHVTSQAAIDASEAMAAREAEEYAKRQAQRQFKEPLPLHRTSMTDSINTPRMGANAPFHISHVFYINLDGRRDRRDALENRLDNIFSGPHTRVRAMQLNATRDEEGHTTWGKQADPLSEVAVETFLRHHPMNRALLVQPTRVISFVGSVFASHVDIFHRILTTYPNHNPDSLFVVLEDDTSLGKDWERQFSRYYAQVPDDWDIIRLDTWGKTREEDMIRPHVCAAKPPFKEGTDLFYAGMHAVVLRPRTLPRVLRHLHTTPLTDIDEMVTACCDGLKSYVLSISSIRIDQGKGGSDHPETMGV